MSAIDHYQYSAYFVFNRSSDDPKRCHRMWTTKSPADQTNRLVVSTLREHQTWSVGTIPARQQHILRRTSILACKFYDRINSYLEKFKNLKTIC